MQVSTTNNQHSLQQLKLLINQKDQADMASLMHLALNGADNQSQNKVFNTLKQIESKAETYLYMLCIFLSKEKYPENIRYITGTTLNSTLKRNSKEVHFEQKLKQLMKSALLQSYQPQNQGKGQTESEIIKKTKTILISQLAVCFEEIDWQMIYFLVEKIPLFTENILSLLITIFEDLKHNSQNFNCYFERATETEVLTAMINQTHQQMLKILSIVNFRQSHNFTNEIPILAKGLKLIRTITFNLPIKLTQYFQSYLSQVIQPILLTFIDMTKQGLDKLKNMAFQTMIEEVFESVNQICETKAEFILRNESFLNIFLSLPVQINSKCSKIYYYEVLKIWTNSVLELVFNDNQNEIMKKYIDFLIPKLLHGFKFTKQDELIIAQEMELEHNPYDNQGQAQQQEQMMEYQEKFAKSSGSTLRKISITCVQKITEKYVQNILSINSTNSVLQTILNSSDPKINQTGIIYLGIIAENNIDYFTESLNYILQYLIRKIDEFQSVNEYAAASCFWTLEKLLPAYSQKSQIKPFCYERIENIMKQKYEDQNKSKRSLILKQAAVSFMDELLTNQTELKYQTLKSMLECLIIGLNDFSGRALYNVFKALTTIFQSKILNNSPDSPTIVNEVIIHLGKKWTNYIQKESVMCPLLECLGIICENQKQYFSIYSYDIIQQLYPLLQDKDKKNIVLRSLDLCSSIVSSMSVLNDSPSIQKTKVLISSEEFLSLLYNLITFQEKQIRHFTYYLISDISKFKIIQQSITIGFIETIAKTMDKESISSANNAMMCLTDMITNNPEFGIKYVQDILEMVVQFISKVKQSKLPKIYLLNFSRMFGRLSILNLQKAKIYFTQSNKQVLKSLSQGLQSQQKSQYTLKSYKGIIMVLNILSAEELFKLIENKQIQSFMDSFMGYRHNQQTQQNMKDFVQLLRKIKHIVQKNNLEWSQYLRNTVLYQASTQKILQMTS